MTLIRVSYEWSFFKMEVGKFYIEKDSYSLKTMFFPVMSSTLLHRIQ